MLFDQELIPGLVTRDELVTPVEEAELIAHITTLNLTPFRFQGFTGKRLTTSFGLAYDFEAGRITRAEPIPEWLDPLRRRAADFAGLPSGDLVQALVIRYNPGAGIGWHRDRPQFGQVVGISLGAPATLAFRQRTATGFKRVKLPLSPRSAYHLAGEARLTWEHGISAHDALRFSITFRSVGAHIDTAVTQAKG
ncbi:alpha-ketoglutarate-dependent dioxygenase AlkB [Sphingomonas glaciei]|uniref:Alpha-ketoglutarate-dependent dioxygenase AlkB n=1 Tax=Sphingomonas glaciei TaxID=2938948 RepID=A0ABY5N1B5_9SPHN|nr:alpha-ketoglutarate-dependent dioxygenase AlkB [Sphingomonas glaciei]UUR09347.1 alpha-ketoglutarate-dependent dioxygenase AlkB [Sphingomonas glaciei]